MHKEKLYTTQLSAICCKSLLFFLRTHRSLSVNLWQVLQGNLVGNLAGILQDFSDPPKSRLRNFQENCRSIFPKRIPSSKTLRAKFVLQTCHPKRICPNSWRFQQKSAGNCQQIQVSAIKCLPKLDLLELKWFFWALQAARHPPR